MRPIQRMAWRNVVKNWRHSIAAILSITAGFVAIGAFEGYISNLRDRYGEEFRRRGMLGDLIIERQGHRDASRDDAFASVLSAADQATIDELLANHAEVVQRTRFLDLSGLLQSGRTSTIFVGTGYDVEPGRAMRGPRWGWNVRAGQPLWAAAEDSDAVVVGQGLAKILDCAAATEARNDSDDSQAPVDHRALECKRSRVQLSTTTETGQLNAVDPEILGIVGVAFEGLSLRYVAMPLALAQRLTDTRAVTRYTVELRDSTRAEAVAAELRAQAAAGGVAVDVLPWQAHPIGETFTRSLEMLSIFRNLVIIIVVIIAGMSVFNTMAKAVSERVREIGTLRSLGFLRREIVWLFSSEAAIIAGLAVIVGLLVIGPLVWAIGRAGIRYQAGILADAITLELDYVPLTYAVTALFLTVVAVAAAVLAARRAAYMKIPDALGHV